MSGLDAAWMVRAWAMQSSNPLKVLQERENIYSVLSQTTDDGINKNYPKYTIDPRTRYKNIPTTSKDEKIIAMYDTDNKEEMRYLEAKFKSNSYFDSLAYANIMRRYRALRAPMGRPAFGRQISLAGAGRVMRVLGKKTGRAKETVLNKLGKIQNSFGRQSSVFPGLNRQTSAHPTMFTGIEEVEGEGGEGGEDLLPLPGHSKYHRQTTCAF